MSPCETASKNSPFQDRGQLLGLVPTASTHGPSSDEGLSLGQYLVAAAGLVPFRTLQNMWYVMRFRSRADFAALPDDLEWAQRIGCYSAQDLLAARDAVRNLLSAAHEMAWTTQADSRR